MKQEDTQRFPQRRNGVSHPVFGLGVVTLAPHNIGEGFAGVKFDNYPDPKIVETKDLTSVPSRGESPDPAVSRFSGYIGGNNYKGRR